MNVSFQFRLLEFQFTCNVFTDAIHRDDRNLSTAFDFVLSHGDERLAAACPNRSDVVDDDDDVR